MKEFLSKHFSGTVHIRVIGNHTELFLNRCINEKIPIWNIKRTDKNDLTAYLFSKDVFLLRPLLRESDCKIQFIEKRGLPFIVRKFWSRSGLVVGFILFITVLFLLSNMVWGIEIKGATPKIEHKIAKELQNLGIQKGKLTIFLPTNQKIQQELSERIKEVTWIGVQLRGTTYEFNVVQKEIPKEKEALSPRNLVAKKTAVITNMFVEQGQPMVKENNVVRKGEVLISGIIGSEAKPQFVPAKGEVLGEVWYQSTVNQPLQRSFVTYTGESKEKYYVTLFGLKIPVWGFGEVPFKETDIKSNEKDLRFLKWELPISFSQEMVYEAEKHERTYTKEEAVELGIRSARDHIQNKLGDEAKIKEMEIGHKSFVNGTVNLKIDFFVIENIAMESPIIKEIE
jgi:similar to stage IV sporulation protein